MSAVTPTFLLTDIEGSTRRWEQEPRAMEQALRRHDALLRALIDDGGGEVLETVGDAFQAAFPEPAAALAAALEIQRALAAEPWPTAAPLRVRMALHAAPADEQAGGHAGALVAKGQRLLETGHGGQILLSQPVAAALVGRLPAGCSLRDFGLRQLKDLSLPEHIYQLAAPDLPVFFPPLRSLDPRPTNLPVPPTSFVGRDAERRELHALLGAPEVRLLTLLGPGGTGKTRLSIQLAHELLDTFADGAWFVALAPINDPQLVTQAVARVFGVAETAGRTLLESLGAALRDKRLLLVLDNFEQVVSAAVPLLVHLNAAAPGVTVIVSSRALLRIPGEREFLVPPLDLPVLRQAGAGRQPSLEAIAGSSAVQLFVERARSARPDFALGADNALAVAEICVKLDGLPLAIELAAARARLLRPRALLERLGSRLGVLTEGARDLPARQQTLRGAIDWSYQLLAPPDRQLFALLGVFVNGCTASGAAAVADNGGNGAAPPIADRLEDLARQSLLRHADGLAAAEPRFMMLETIREFAVEQLEQRGDAARIRRRHAEYAMRLAADASASWGTPQRPEWAARIDQEQENMRAALAWLLDTGAAEQALRLALLLEPFWAMRANFSEGRRWIERALAPETRPALPPELEAQAYAALSGNCFATADLAAGVPYMERNLELQRALGDPGQISKALVLFGMAMRNLGDFPRATALLEESLAVSRASGDRHGEAQALNDLGLLVFFQDDLDQAIAYSEASLALFRALGAGGGIAIALNDLGEMVRFGGDYARAAALYDESLALARQQGNQRQVMFGLGNLASALLMLGDDGRAGPLFAESLALLREAEMIHLTGFCLDGLGGVAARRGAPARAARLLAASSAMAVRSEQIRSPADEQLYQTHLELARAQLAPAAWEAAWAEGSALGVEAAIALALEPLDADTA